MNERKKMHCTICTICTMEGKVQKVQKVQGKKMTVQIFIQAAWHAGQWTTYEETRD